MLLIYGKHYKVNSTNNRIATKFAAERQRNDISLNVHIVECIIPYNLCFGFAIESNKQAR